MYDEVRAARISATEGFLTLLSGLRKVPEYTPEDKVCNSALADAFDYYIENEPKNLYDFTIKQGKWVRD